MRCPYCGGEISGTARACGHCGRWLPVAPVIPAASEEQEQRSWLFFGMVVAVALALFAGVCCLVGGFLVLGMQQASQSEAQRGPSAAPATPRPQLPSPAPTNVSLPPTPTDTPPPPTRTPLPPPPTPTHTPRPAATNTPRATNTPPVTVLTGKITFPVLNADRRHYDTWVVNADGTNARHVAEKMHQPCFRPDGVMLAVNGEAQYQEHIIIMNADGANKREGSRHVEDSHPSWSPDGARLVYDTTAAPGGGWQICIVDDIVQRSWHALPGPGGGFGGLRGRYPTWMPDGRIILNTADYWATDAQGGLYIVGEGGGTPTRITSSKQDTAPAVHDSTVAFMSVRQGSDYEVFTASVTGGLDASLKQLTDNGAQDGLPAWSPDGQHIAFVSDEGGAWGLWVMRAVGSGRRKLLDLPGSLGGDWSDERVSWAP